MDASNFIAADEVPLVNVALSEKGERRVLDVKREHRAELKTPEAWERQRHAQIWPTVQLRLIREASVLPRYVNGHTLTPESFRRDFHVPRIPCVISGLADDWPARHKWSFEQLMRNHPKLKLKCGEDDDEMPLKLSVKTFLQYQATQARKDDSPLYCFDSSFDKDTSPLLLDYHVPFIFDEDLFQLVSNHRRPPHRWFLLGPERSGTCVHTDPLGTSAWNTLIRGRKLWAFFPPSVPRHVVKGKTFVKPGGDDEAIDWFAHLLPKIRASLGGLVDGFALFIQQPGETVFVPADWHHAVLNLDDTVAVTHNFVDTANFARSWKETRVERRKMARKLRDALKTARPDLYQVTVDMDTTDGYDLDEEIRQKHARHKQHKQHKKKSSTSSS